MLLLGFYGMLRSKEFLQASAKNLAWSWNKKGQLTFKSQFADKTHLSKDRKVLVPVNSGWEQAASALIVRAKVKRTLRTHQILEPKERAAIKLALKKVKSSPGCIRPGGNMYWLQRGVSKSTDTQARGVGAQLEHPEQALHLHEQMGSAAAAKGIVSHNVLRAGL